MKRRAASPPGTGKAFRPGTPFALLVVWAAAFNAGAQTINLTGSWSPASSTTILAGENPIVNIASPTYTFKIDIRNANKKDWNVTMYLTGWDSNLTLEVQRLGGGAGITRGALNSYYTLSGTSQEFFAGTGNINNIPIQYRINSTNLTYAGTHTATVYYTVTQE